MFHKNQIVQTSSGLGRIVRKQGAGGYMVRVSTTRTVLECFSTQTYRQVSVLRDCYFKTDSIQLPVAVA